MNKPEKTLFNILMVVGIVIFVLSVVMIARHYILGYKYQNDFKKISYLAPLPSSQHSEQTDEEYTPEEFYLYLKYQNKDTRAYITIPDTDVAYPVMYTFDQPEYYLRRDFSKNYSRYGTPFYETECADYGHTRIIYGHHISGKKMFGELLNYKDENYLLSHDTIYLYNENGEQKYKVFAALYTVGNDPDQIFWRAINGLFTEEEYQTYLDDIKSKSAVFVDYLVPEPLTDLLILSTCEYSVNDGRFLLYAAQID